MRSLGVGAAAVVLAGLSACDKQPAATTATDAAAPAVAPVGGKDWLQEMAVTPEGGFRLGNPDAKVKLVEYASLTCSHCRDFKSASDAVLTSRYVASGNVSFEFRNLILNGPDAAASVLARCEGPRQFFNLTNALFATQDQWMAPFTKLTPDDQKRLGGLPQDRQIAELAKLGGLDNFMKARGMTAAQFDKCVGDPAALKRLTDMSTAAGNLGVTGTPTFFINGVKQDGVGTWSQLEPKLQSALS